MRTCILRRASSILLGPGKVNRFRVPSSTFVQHFQQKQLQTSSRFLGTPAPSAPPSSDPKDGTSSKSPEEAYDVVAEAKEIESLLRAELSKANTETASFRTKCTELEDKYMRSLADSENLRARLTKQIQDQKLYAIQGFCKDLTEIEDILSLAIASVPKEEVTGGNKHLKELYDGLKMTEARLLQVFKSHGLTQINPLNAKFNPNEHEAVMQKEEEGKESGTVTFVSKLGYKLHDRVIRPAIVGVAK